MSDLCFRGFGFITFADPESVNKVLAQGTHELDGKKVSLSVVAVRADFAIVCCAVMRNYRC